MDPKLQKELFEIINNRNLNIEDPAFKKQLKYYFTKFRPNNTRKSRSLASPHTIAEIMANETMPRNMKKKLIHAAARSIYDHTMNNMNLVGKSAANIKRLLAERREAALKELVGAFEALNATAVSRTRSRSRSRKN